MVADWIRARTFALAPLLASVLWGGMYVVSKWGFDAVPPVTLAALRVAVGTVVLLLVVGPLSPDGGTRPAVDRADWWGFGVLGFWVAVTLVTQFVGTDLTTASEGALITVLTPIATVALGVAVLGERLTLRRASGMTVALGGTIVVVTARNDVTAIGSGGTLGVSLLLLASVGWAVYTVWGKPLVRKYSALETATYSALLATPMLVAASAVELAVTGVSPTDVPVTAGTIGTVLYLGVAATAIAWYLWYKGVEYVDTGTVAVYFFAQPVVGAALGAALLGEALGVGFAVGGGLMAVGIYVVSTASAPETGAAGTVEESSEMD